MAILKLALYWANTVLVVFALISIIKARKSPASTIAWILGLIFLPFLGLLVYVLAGMDRRERRLVRQVPEDVFSAQLTGVLERQTAVVEQMVRSTDPVRHLAARSIRLLTRAAAAPVTTGNSVTPYFSGGAMFDALVTDIEAARESIHMEFYIWKSDDLGRRILDVLSRRAAGGVKVRLIFDGWGSFGKISYAYRRELRRAGIEFAYFLDLANPVARFKINYRNHRKIVVIDGRIAYTGGMNVGEEYITGGRRFESWRDTHIRITGPAVSMLQALFLLDWRNSGREESPRDSLFPEFDPIPEADGIPMQIAIGGPDSPWEGLRLHYLELLNGAREEILIQTPYYIPGEAIEQAMIAAAIRGVRVVLMTVSRPDYWIPFWAAQTYFPPLLEAGVEIQRYQAGFLHSKVFIQDRTVASVGTCNVDLRSFHLDYEVNAVMYSPQAAGEMATQFDADLRHCSPLTLDEIARLPIHKRLRNSFFRLLSPLM